MIKSVEILEWKDILCRWKWMGELKTKINNNEFRNISVYNESYGVSKYLNEIYKKFEKYFNSEDKMSILISWLNYKIGEDYIQKPDDETNFYWLKINELSICIKITETWYADGITKYSVIILYIDNKGTDQEWAEIINDFINLVKEKMNNTSNDLWEEWCDCEVYNKKERA